MHFNFYYIVLLMDVRVDIGLGQICWGETYFLVLSTERIVRIINGRGVPANQPLTSLNARG